MLDASYTLSYTFNLRSNPVNWYHYYPTWQMRKLKFLNAKLTKGGDFESKLPKPWIHMLWYRIIISIHMSLTAYSDNKHTPIDFFPGWISYFLVSLSLASPKDQRWPWRWGFRVKILATGRTGFGIKADGSEQENPIVTAGTSLGAVLPAFN